MRCLPDAVPWTSAKAVLGGANRRRPGPTCFVEAVPYFIDSAARFADGPAAGELTHTDQLAR